MDFARKQRSRQSMIFKSNRNIQHSGKNLIKGAKGSLYNAAKNRQLLLIQKQNLKSGGDNA